MSIYTIEEIKEILPHRHPFLFIDAVDEVIPGERVVARKNVSYNEHLFQGHFPEQAVFPGVLICEAMAQAGGIGILALDEYKGKLAFFGAMEKVRFRGKVVPGDVLRLEVEVKRLRGRAGVAQGHAYVGDDLVAEAEMTFFIGDA